MMLEIKFKVQIIEVSAGVARLADAADATFLGYDQPPPRPSDARVPAFQGTLSPSWGTFKQLVFSNA